MTGSSVALRADGTLWAWGENYWGQLGIGTFDTNAPYARNTPQQVGTNADWHAVAAGLVHTVALRADGTLWTWGYNRGGELGNGTFETNAPYGTSTPQQIGSDTDWLAITASDHTIALRADGTLWAWGFDRYGESGIGTYNTTYPYGTTTNAPQRIGSDSNWLASAASENHTVALRADGTLWAWGANQSGQLGIGTYYTNEPYGTNRPQQVGTNTNWGPPP